MPWFQKKRPTTELDILAQRVRDEERVLREGEKAAKRGRLTFAERFYDNNNLEIARILRSVESPLRVSTKVRNPMVHSPKRPTTGIFGQIYMCWMLTHMDEAFLDPDSRSLSSLGTAVLIELAVHVTEAEPMGFARVTLDYRTIHFAQQLPLIELNLGELECQINEFAKSILNHK